MKCKSGRTPPVAISKDEEVKGGIRTPKKFEVDDIQIRVVVGQSDSADGMESLVNSLKILATKKNVHVESELSRKLETEEAD